MLTADEFKSVNDELERYDCLLKASEDWSSQYEKDPVNHAKLIRTEAKLAKNLRSHFKELSKQASLIINTYAYNGAIKADYSIETIINDGPIAAAQDAFVSIMFEQLSVATGIGASSGESIYKIPLGIQSTDAIMQELTMQQVGRLVGKIVNPDGKLIDNPKSEYSVTDSIRNDVRKSIQTSINLGEDQSSATDRLGSVISNPRRASTISQTETVNAYSNGLLEFGKQSGAVGKEWQDVGAVDVCGEYADRGVVDFSDDYDGLDGPAAHPNCRCGLRLEYQNS